MLFRKKIQRSCLYCDHGVVLPAGKVICAKKGIVSVDSACSKFEYDPLKRVPPRKKLWISSSTTRTIFPCNKYANACRE